MRIEYKNQDLFSCKENIIAHGCNCQRKMGKGVALGIKNKYPEAYDIYVKRKQLILGDVIVALSKNTLILNCLTQEFYGKDGKKYISYDAIDSCMKHINHLFKNRKDTRVAMPKIGCSLGGGNWNIVERIIEENSLNFQPVVYLGVEK